LNEPATRKPDRKADPKSDEVGIGPLFRLALDFGPILIFFVVNAMTSGPDKMAQVRIATTAFMGATALAMIVSKLRTGRISPMLWLSGALVLVFGGLTLYFADADFIKMKPTIVYLMFSSILGFGLATGRPLLRQLLGSAYPGLNDAGWRRLTINWALFFVVMAIVNELVWRNSSWDFWVGFKLWGAMPITLLFAAANIPMLLKHGLTADKVEAEAAGAPPPQ